MVVFASQNEAGANQGAGQDFVDTDATSANYESTRTYEEDHPSLLLDPTFNIQYSTF